MRCQDCDRADPGVALRADGYTLCDQCNLLHRNGLPDGYTRYTVHGLDVWGNADDGYEVNDIYPSQGVIDLPDDANRMRIIALLQAGGYVRADIDPNLVTIDDDGYDIHLDYDGRPEMTLRREP